MGTIKELVANQGKVEILAVVVDVESPREFQKFGRSGKVANAKIRDATGEIKLTLWNEQVEQVKKGDTIKIINGWVSEWQGEKQLSTGKFGSLEVTGSGSPVDDAPVSESKPISKSHSSSKKPSKKKSESDEDDDSGDGVEEEFI